MTSRADRHDLDKLRRWRADMDAPGGAEFPVHAIFLVSEVDRAAHDVFRAFRSSFEERDAGFQNLVIFGQHGVSGAVRAVAGRLGLEGEPLPQLALLVSGGTPLLYSLGLPAGDADTGQPDPDRATAAQLVLAGVETLVDGRSAGLEEAGIAGLTPRELPDMGLTTLVEGLIAELS